MKANKMIVIPTELNTGTNEGYKKSEQAEYAAALLLASKLDLDVNTLDITKGFFPDYDFLIEDLQKKEITFEVKYTSKRDILIEYARGDGTTPSGIQVNKSDYTVLINHQSANSNGTWIDVGKIRLYETSSLLAWTMKAKDDSRYDTKKYPRSNTGPGSANVIFRPKQYENELPHLWIGDVKCDTNPIAYHMDKLLLSSSADYMEQTLLKLDWNF
ncbi:hypothetical protein LCGC14_1262420 [marine sediment metagenome]|uniref:Uncharacterized protein n=1 Tax=marine sediment metagenome TaxID=412755 RepID=A0A0F9NH15_9ZZZZ